MHIRVMPNFQVYFVISFDAWSCRIRTQSSELPLRLCWTLLFL